MTSILFQGFSQELRDIVKNNFAQSNLKQGWHHVYSALVSMFALYEGRFVGQDSIMGSDKPILRIDTINYPANILQRAKVFRENYDALNRGITFAINRHRNLCHPASEPKNKNLLPKTLSEFFYNSYKQDSYFLHLVFDPIYNGHLIERRQIIDGTNCN